MDTILPLFYVHEELFYLFPSVTVECFVVPLQLNDDDVASAMQTMILMMERAVKSPPARCALWFVCLEVISVAQAVDS